MNTNDSNQSEREERLKGISPDGGEAACPPAPSGEDLPDLLNVAHPVTRHIQITSPANWQFLLAGIDTLDLGFYVQWGEGWSRLHESLTKGKTKAEGSEGELWSYRNTAPLLILPRGRRMYAFTIRHPAGLIYISNKQSPEGYPNVYVSLLAERLWQLGILPSIELICRVIADMGGSVEAIQVSRADLAADMYVEGGLSLDLLREHHVCRSQHWTPYINGDTLETFNIGGFGSAVRLRIYDKSREIVKSGKSWFHDLWKCDHTKDIWRVEFQLRRDALKQFEINSIDDLRDRVGGIWKNLTTGWFSLRRGTGKNVTRREVIPWWFAVQSLADQFGREMMIERRRKPDSIADPAWYISHAAGCLAAYAAHMKLSDINVAGEALKAEIESYWMDKDFQDRYIKNRKKLGFDDEGGDSK